MVISIIGILAGIGSWLVIFFADNFLYLPNKLNMDMVFSDVFEIICEGDSSSGGLRFSNDTLVSNPNRIRFTDQYGNNVVIRASSNKIRRNINWEGLEPIPYYTPLSLNITGKDGKAFEYYDEYGNITTETSAVKRVEIHLEADMGDLTGEAKTSVSLRK